MSNDAVSIKYLTNEELCMLEQLTYLSEDVAEMASNLDAGFNINVVSPIAIPTVPIAETTSNIAFFRGISESTPKINPVNMQTKIKYVEMIANAW